MTWPHPANSFAQASARSGWPKAPSDTGAMEHAPSANTQKSGTLPMSSSTFRSQAKAMPTFLHRQHNASDALPVPDLFGICLESGAPVQEPEANRILRNRLRDAVS